jgi:hypothetical protein
MEIELLDEDKAQEAICYKSHPRSLLYHRIRSDRMDLTLNPMSHPDKVIRSPPKFTPQGPQIHMNFCSKPLIGKYVHSRATDPDYPGYKVNLLIPKKNLVLYNF